ncbi:MAG: WGR domain-containing protein [Sporocytophaga sp.]|uniref:WGR domain-containing protein n=1 Tax=Sporocytophaga sp. TaxID=2231183 RepID=UPI001B1E65EE|nr:WGR domain-containing protein [Sporocytophaga sp.]MBO9699549.1 WGR domain-containing protein [Sporocytophaga sp.]
MKLIKQIKLYFQEGNSDKVYEIDLCESGDGFLVNFRYGRRGATLKEGTKTIFPVDLQEANKVFDSLEKEKRSKGYSTEGEPMAVFNKPTKGSKDNDRRKKAILKILKNAVDGDEPENWPLARVFWRAGELNIQEAIPFIQKLVDQSDDISVYSAVWAIGKCGNSSSVTFLKSLQQKQNCPQYLREIISEALFKISDLAERKTTGESLLAILPEHIMKLLQLEDYSGLDIQLKELLFKTQSSSNEYLSSIYRLSHDNNELKRILSGIINDVPLTYNYFKHIRHIFKMAEMWEDYEIFGIVAKNIDKHSPGPYSDKGAFSSKTKRYLSARILRSLRRLGEANASTYKEMACGVLLAFDDSKDGKPSYHRSTYTYVYNKQTKRHDVIETKTYFDTNAIYRAFNFILFQNSPRYTLGPNGWQCISPYMPVNEAPSQREEAFPELWNNAVKEIIRLLSFSKASQVHEFALKVFKSNPEFANQLTTENIVDFLNTSFEITRKVGLEEAMKVYNKANPDTQLLLGMLQSPLQEASEQAIQWIEEQKQIFINNSEFITELIFIRNPFIQTKVRSLLVSANIPNEQAEIVIGKILATIIKTEGKSEDDQQFVIHAGQALLDIFKNHLDFIGTDIIRDLLQHRSPEVHAIAGSILVYKKLNPELIPGDLLQALLKSENKKARTAGIELLGRFSETSLIEKKELLISFCLSPLADVRNAVKPIIAKLTKAYPAFGNELIDLFVPAFLMKETYEGLHQDLLSLLTTELSNNLSVINKNQSLFLLNSKFRSAQQLGAALLKLTIREEDLSMAELVKISSNPNEEVRKYAWNYYNNNHSKIKENKEEALRIVDSDWEDTRNFAFDYFRNIFKQEDWSADDLIALCDSTRETVQNFGKEMITKFFKSEDGDEYLLKLSQHPDTRLQLFTSSYIETYASGKPDVVEKLKPYFITLLSQVNKGKAAKMRAMEFLRKEALKDESIAQIASEILNRVSGSMAITEKAGCIAALRDIRKKYPSLQNLVKVVDYSEYVKK